MKQAKNITKKDLWGKDLFIFFSEHIDDDGWLTEDWCNILDDECPLWSLDDSKVEKNKDISYRMEWIELERSECGKFIRPII